MAHGIAETALLLLVMADGPHRAAPPLAATPIVADTPECARAHSAGADCCFHPYRRPVAVRSVAVDSYPPASHAALPAQGR